MLEESITSSPQKPNRSIHKVRIHRKNKRLRLDDSSATQSHVNSITDEKSQLNATFVVQESLTSFDDRKTKDNSSNLNTTGTQPQLAADFDPFEDELLLAVADRLDCAQISSSSQFANVGHGFASCAQLFRRTSSTSEITEVQSSNIPLSKSPEIAPITIDKNAEVKKLYEPRIDPITSGPKTQFGVTASELLHFCDIAECRKEEKHQPLEKVLQTPENQKQKSIVDSILEDFCSSPASLDGTPIFRFKNEQIRTYSRRRVVFSNPSYTDALGNVEPPSNIEDDDVMSNCSSGLSVQEDLTQPLDNLDHSIENDDLNNKNVCENLLNLSAYFTQHSVEVDSSLEEKSSSVQTTNFGDLFESKVEVLNQLVNEIISVREKVGTFKTSDSYNQNSSEFFGFPLCGGEEIPEVPSACLDKNTRIEEISDAQQFTGIVHDNPMHSRGSDNKEKDFAIKHNDEIIFSECEEEWNDCDFFKNFSTQDAFYKSDDVNMLSDIDTGNVNYSSPKYLRKNSIDEDLGNIQLSEWPVDDYCTIKYNIPVATTEFPGFQTASNKEIKISDDAKFTAAKLLENLPDLPNSAPLNDLQTSNQLINENNSTTNGIISNSTSKTEFKGFQIASKKCIKASGVAKLKAEKVLESLPDFPSEIKLNSVDLQKTSQLINEHTTTANDNTSIRKIEFKGFQTASNKSINISDDAKNKGAKILENLPHIPKKKVECAELHTKKYESLKSVNQVNSFHTAAKKLLQISEEAKLKAKNILSSNPEIPPSKSNISVEEELNDIQFSEWPLNDQSETEDGKQMNILPSSTKRKFEPETCQPVERNAKIICRSNDVRSPLAPRTENFLPKSASFDTFTKKNNSITQFAKSGLIARKNLLSLTERRKSKTVQEPSIQKVNPNVATTPLKAQSNVQTKIHTPETPNLNEFIEFIPDTSTPRAIKTNCFNNVQQQQSKVDEIDSDFQQIKWEESISKSVTVSTSNLNCTKLSDSSNANITFNGANRSPKQRIGQPPPVTSISMPSKYNCRTLGVRVRSITKKKY